MICVAVCCTCAQLSNKAYRGGLAGIVVAGKVRDIAQELPRTCLAQRHTDLGACPQGVVQEGAIVRGDLAKMVLGKYCTVGKNVVMHPVFYPRAQGCAAIPGQRWRLWRPDRSLASPTVRVRLCLP